MTFQPGQSGNPNGYGGPRQRRRHEVFELIKGLDHKDALVTLSTIAHESQDPFLQVQAAAALAPYCHPKLRATPTPRFIENPINVPDFQTIDDAKKFLARIPALIARGELDLDFADSLTKSTVAWLQLQYAEMGIDLKAQAQGAADHDQVIRIAGGLPALPGTNVTMPNLTNGHDAYQMLDHQTQNPSSIDGVHTDTTTQPAPNGPVATDP
jgi:hypothetical protein